MGITVWRGAIVALTVEQIEEYVLLRLGAQTSPVSIIQWIIDNRHELGREQDVIDYLADQASVNFDANDPDKITDSQKQNVESYLLSIFESEGLTNSGATESLDKMKEIVIDRIHLILNDTFLEAQ